MNLKCTLEVTDSENLVTVCTSLQSTDPGLSCCRWQCTWIYRNWIVHRELRQEAIFGN